jgi:hypothetical protein
VRQPIRRSWPRLTLGTTLSCTIALVVWACVTTALARDPSAAERQALAERVAAFTRIVDEKRYGDMLQEMPPRLFATFVKRTGMPEEQLRPLMQAQIDKVMQLGSIDAFKIDVANAAFKVLVSGEPYALIPTTTDMTMQGKRMIARSVTLAMRENGRWYLVRIAAAQLPILRETYPEFTTVEFPEDRLEMKP